MSQQMSCHVVVLSAPDHLGNRRHHHAAVCCCSRGARRGGGGAGQGRMRRGQRSSSVSPREVFFFETQKRLITCLIPKLFPSTSVRDKTQEDPEGAFRHGSWSRSRSRRQYAPPPQQQQLCAQPRWRWGFTHLASHLASPASSSPSRANRRRVPGFRGTQNRPRPRRRWAHRALFHDPCRIE